jgi:uncharacterized membrane protein YgcG
VRNATLLFAGILAFGLDAAAMEIESFDVSILLDPDGTIFVTETIDVDFGALERHGIFRTIPVSYGREETIAGIPVGTRYALRLRVLGVEDENGAPIRFTTLPEDTNVFVRIGDPELTVTGKRTYVIAYRVQRAINYFETHDELYWNATGTEWDWPIHRASARVQLPSEVAPETLRHQTFTGAFGSRTTKAAERFGAQTYEAEATGLLPGEGLTFVLGLPKGVLEPLPAWRERWWKAGDNVAYFVVALLPILTFAAMLFLYLRTGRDPGRRTPIVVEYEPPEDLSPAEVGTLLDERIDIPDIVSTVIDLAVRGYLAIREEETTRLLFLTNMDYRFEKLKPADDAMQSHEREFFSALFPSGDSVLLSRLKNRFYSSIPSIETAIMRQMLSKGLFPRDPASVRRFYRGIAVAFALVSLFIGIFLLSSGQVRYFLPPQPVAFVVFSAVAIIATSILVRLFARVMPAKTAKGARLARYCLGFREFVTRVEKDRLERMSREDPTLFERVLPYAMVLGCADEWAERFEGLLTEPLSWYVSTSFTPGRFDSRSLVSGLGRSMHSMGSTLTSHPREGGVGFSFGAGSGSSGFGGGGSSGGGFGGGGGGSW